MAKASKVKKAAGNKAGKKKQRKKRKMRILRREQQRQQQQQQERIRRHPFRKVDSPIIANPPIKADSPIKANPPSGWTDFEDFGDPIDVLIPIRVPLDSNRYIGPIRSLQELMDIQHTQHNRSVGMVIDLTATNKYYSAKRCVPSGLTHVKIAIDGTPGRAPHNMVREFLHTVEQFKAKNPGKFIFVHCTHGINRTGYMVCSYMIQQNSMQASEAISLFQTRRPPGMHNSLFLADLLVRYGDVHCELFKQFLRYDFPKSPPYVKPKKEAINLHCAMKILRGASQDQPQSHEKSSQSARNDSSPQEKASEEVRWRRDRRVVEDNAGSSEEVGWRRDSRMVDNNASSSEWRRDRRMVDDNASSSESVRCVFSDYGSSSGWRRDQQISTDYDVHSNDVHMSEPSTTIPTTGTQI